MPEQAQSADRRQFLQQAATLAAGAALGAAALPTRGAEPTKTEVTPMDAGEIPRKPLGKTGVQVSCIGLGGYSLGDAPTQDDAARIVHEAIDAGVNFFDNAWEYHKGKSETWLGHALAGKRDKVILMTKVCTHGRDKKMAMQQLEESLLRLRTDHLDVWQIHECVYFNDPDWHFAPGGVVEALEQAKKQGKVRFVGFTGHKDPRIHLKMLSHDFPFDTVQMPLNPFDATFRSFEQHVLPEVNRRGMAALGMKSLCGGGPGFLQSGLRVDEALGYAMSLPVSVTISGIDTIDVLHQNLAIARGFKPWPEERMQALRDRCAAFASDGHLELYKSTKKFDGEIGREMHGFPKPEQLPL